jgi:hypothetical protein
LADWAAAGRAVSGVLQKGCHDSWLTRGDIDTWLRAALVVMIAAGAVVVEFG